MALTTQDNYFAAQALARQVKITKTSPRTTIAAVPFSLFDVAGVPAAGVLPGVNTASGVVPTDATQGCPLIDAFTGANTGYISGIEASNTVAGRIAIYDLVYKAGAYGVNSDVTLASQPSYAARVPDYKMAELWLEAATAFTGNQTIQINYLNEAGAAGDTGAIATATAPTLGRMYRMPLGGSDKGVSQVTRVRSSVHTVGTFNVLVMRKLWEGRIREVNGRVNEGLDFLRLRRIYDTSALFMVVYADSTSSGLPEVVLDIMDA